jgi:hypothetical protein
MINYAIRTCVTGFCALALVAAGSADPTIEIVKDRNVLPKNKHEALPGKVIGLLVADAQSIVMTEGRSGPPDSMGFARGLHSYRWVYVPTQDRPIITNLAVRVGDGTVQTFPALNMANPKTVTPWGIMQPYSLVEVEVNSGLGSPADMSFVGTNFKVLDGTKDYPLKVTDVVTQLKKRYADWQAENAMALDKALADAQAAALKDKKPTGRRQRSELLYLTWLPQTERVRAQFVTKITDGAYTEMGGGAKPFDPPPLPPGRVKPVATTTAPPLDPRAARPFPIKVKTGIAFGIDYGMAYEVDKEGKLVRIERLPVQAFTEVLQAPPVVRPGLDRLPATTAPPSRGK